MNRSYKYNADHIESLVDEYPNCDVHSSSEKYRARFAGEVGQYFLDRQWEVVSLGIPTGQSLKILDVGGGHAQVVERLAGSGHEVTVLGSELVCAERLQTWLANGQCKFEVGNFLDMHFSDRSFDIVISLRQTAHIENHKKFIQEMCRVAKQRVIIDYAPIFSFNLSYPVLFWLKKYIEKGTRLFFIHSCREIASCFKKVNFVCVSEVGQFFWPLVVHRFFKNKAVSVKLEWFANKLGLIKVFGSPKIVIMDRI